MTTSSATTPPLPAPEQVSAIRSRRAHVVLWGTFAVTLVVDLLTKAWAFSSLGPHEVRPGLFGWVQFQRSLNDGALFGMGKGWVPLFIGASLLAIAFILYFFACSDRRQWVLHIALGLVLAGAMGNMFDRMFMHADRVVVKDASGQPQRLLGQVVGHAGAHTVVLGIWPEGADPQTYSADQIVEPPRRIGVVRDFIRLNLSIAGRELWPWVFNIADSLLVVGVGILLAAFAVDRRSGPPCPAAEPDGADSNTTR